MVNRSRTVRRGMQPALGAPGPSSPSMRAARRSHAAWLRFRAPPVDRQHPAAHSRNPAPASTRPVDARIGPVRPASACRPASEPPSIRPHTSNRRLGALLWPAQPVQTRSVGAQPPVGRRSAFGQVRFGPQPGPGRSMSPPLRPPAAAQAARQPPTPTRQGPPAPPPRPPAQFPAGAGTRAHTYARACGVEFCRKKIRERGRCPVQASIVRIGVDDPRCHNGARLWRK